MLFLELYKCTFITKFMENECKGCSLGSSVGMHPASNPSLRLGQLSWAYSATMSLSHLVCGNLGPPSSPLLYLAHRSQRRLSCLEFRPEPQVPFDGKAGCSFVEHACYFLQQWESLVFDALDLPWQPLPPGNWEGQNDGLLCYPRAPEASAGHSGHQLGCHGLYDWFYLWLRSNHWRAVCAGTLGQGQPRFCCFWHKLNLESVLTLNFCCFKPFPINFPLVLQNKQAILHRVV